MTTRTIYVIGQGFSATPVSVVATVNGVEVQNGPITTVNDDISVTQAPDHDILQNNLTSAKTNIFSFEVPVDFAGEVPVTLTVSGGPIWFGKVIGNYTQNGSILNPVLSPSQVATIEDPTSTPIQLQQIQIDIAVPAFTADEIALIQQTTNPPYPADTQTLIESHNATFYVSTSSGPDTYAEILDLDGDQDTTWSAVSINGVPQTPTPDAYDPPRTGTWWWTVHESGTFTGNIQISAGLE